jgi:hypothetical protein
MGLMLREHFINQFDNFICGWYIDKTVCEDLIQYHKSCENKKQGTFGAQRKVNKKIKDSVDCVLQDSELSKRYYNELQKCVDLYIEKYKGCNVGPAWKNTENANLQYYEPGGGYHVWHCERYVMTPPEIYRHLVFLTYLNDVNDAGETEFMYQKLKIKPETALTIIFPADWTFTHRGIASPTEEKYIYTGWFNFYTEDK